MAKQRATFPRALLLFYYTFFVIQGIFSWIEESYVEQRTILPYLPLLGGFLGLISAKYDEYFVPVAYLIGIVVALMAIVSYIALLFGEILVDGYQRIVFVIFSILILGTAYVYQFQLTEDKSRI